MRCASVPVTSAATTPTSRSSTPTSARAGPLSNTAVEHRRGFKDLIARVTLGEVGLHTLRGRLTAGLLSKAERGDLALALPAGLARGAQGTVTRAR